MIDARFCRVAVLLLVLLGVGTDPVNARVWRVRLDGTGDSTSIQETVDAAVEGDSVYIGSGDYTAEEFLDIQKGLWIKGEGEGDDRPVLPPSWIHAEEFELRQIRILSAPGRRALFCRAAARAVIEDCEFSGAEWSGIECSGRTRIARCTFVGNSVDAAPSDFPNGGGGVAFFDGIRPGSQLEVEDCTFVGNRSPSEGGAIWVCPSSDTESSVVIRNNLFVGNEAKEGGAIYAPDCTWELITTIENNTFIANKSGGAAVLVVGGVLLNNNIFAYNDCLGYWVWEPYGASACGCNLFWENHSVEPGGPQMGGYCIWIDRPGYRYAEEILDPEFCDSQEDDYSLRANSPGLPKNLTDRFQEWGCEGRMGAFDMGCGFPATVRTSWGDLKRILGGAEEKDGSGEEEDR